MSCGACTSPSDHNLAAIQKALEAAGVEFTNGSAPGVRLRSTLTEFTLAGTDQADGVVIQARDGALLVNAIILRTATDDVFRRRDLTSTTATNAALCLGCAPRRGQSAMSWTRHRQHPDEAVEAAAIEFSTDAWKLIAVPAYQAASL